MPGNLCWDDFKLFSFSIQRMYFFKEKYENPKLIRGRSFDLRVNFICVGLNRQCKIEKTGIGIWVLKFKRKTHRY